MNNPPDIWRDTEQTFGSLRPLLRQIDEIFNEIAGPNASSDLARQARSMPACDLDESEDHYLLTVDMPGVPKDDINVEVQGNQIYISGERRDSSEKKGGRSRMVERRFGRFERMLALPEPIDASAVEADYRDGILKIAVPKSSEAKRTKVKLGEAGKHGFLSRLFSGIKDKAQASVDVKAAEETTTQMH